MPHWNLYTGFCQAFCLYSIGLQRVAWTLGCDCDLCSQRLGDDILPLPILEWRSRTARGKERQHCHGEPRGRRLAQPADWGEQPGGSSDVVGRDNHWGPLAIEQIEPTHDLKVSRNQIGAVEAAATAKYQRRERGGDNQIGNRGPAERFAKMLQHPSDARLDAIRSGPRLKRDDDSALQHT